MNHLEKYIPGRRDASATAMERDAAAWRTALLRQSLPGGMSPVKSADATATLKPLSGWAKAMSAVRHDIS